MKIAMCSVFAWHMQDFLKFEPNRIAYCNRHGYDYYGTDEHLLPSRHPAWSKLVLVGEKLPDYDWVFWLDGDCLITDPTRKLESFITDDYDFIIQNEKDDDGPYRINSGVFLIRNCEGTRELLEQIWEHPEQSDFTCEQLPLRLLLQDNKKVRHRIISSNAKFSEKFQAFYYWNEYNPEDKPFVVHWASAVGLKEKIAAMDSVAGMM